MTEAVTVRPAAPPRPLSLGFVGVGWIGRHRMQALLDAGVARAGVVADPSAEASAAALAAAPGARAGDSLEAVLDAGVEGVVIATPSAQHAAQTIQALEAGVPVFCQKPLGRDAGEVRRAVAAARTADRLLGVDLSYRFTAGMAAIQPRVQAGEIGRVFAVDLVFHNAYGPDKPWFFDPAQSGGGCVADLGVHLVDLALWTLGWPAVDAVESALWRAGERLPPDPAVCEDYAVASLRTGDGALIRLACSWHASAGQDAVIEAVFHGTRGGAALRNVGGSFLDFTAELNHGTSRTVLAAPPDAWGGRAAVDWARRVAAGERFDPASERLVVVAEVLDRIYGRCGS